jgi:hypothetical protein
MKSLSDRGMDSKTISQHMNDANIMTPRNKRYDAKIVWVCPFLIHSSNRARSTDGKAADIKHPPKKDESQIRPFGNPTIHGPSLAL